jgi:SsrA-binding protein
MPANHPNPPASPRMVNRKARHDYHILESLEVGVVLQGSEVKSIRDGKASLAEGYAMVDPRSLELFLYDVDIAPYDKAHGQDAHAPKRIRKLLAHRREIIRLQTRCASKGTALVPLAMYFVRGKVKVELGLALGKKAHDKRESLKAREAEREMRRGMTRRAL